MVDDKKEEVKEEVPAKYVPERADLVISKDKVIGRVHSVVYSFDESGEPFEPIFARVHYINEQLELAARLFQVEDIEKI